MVYRGPLRFRGPKKTLYMKFNNRIHTDSKPLRSRNYQKSLNKLKFEKFCIENVIYNKLLTFLDRPKKFRRDYRFALVHQYVIPPGLIPLERLHIFF